MHLLLLHKQQVLDTTSSSLVNVLTYVASYIANQWQSYNHTVKVAEASKGIKQLASYTLKGLNKTSQIGLYLKRWYGGCNFSEGI